MSLEQNNSMSSLDKIKNIKQDVELKRQQEAQIQKEKEKQENIDKEQAYEQEKDSLAPMLSRREEILKKLDEIKSRRGEIIKIGHKAVTEARQDEEVEKVLHTKEGFDEVFSGEKTEWKSLQDEVVALNEELQNLNLLIPEKEKQVRNLFEQTPAGQEALINEHKEYISSVEEKIGLNFDKSVSNYNYYLKPNQHKPYFESFGRNPMNSIRANMYVLSQDNFSLPAVKDVSREDYNEALTAYLYGKFVGNNEDVKKAKIGDDIKREIRASIEFNIFKKENKDELGKLHSEQELNTFVEQNEDAIKETKEKLEKGLQELMDKTRTLFETAKNSKEYKEKFNDIDLEKYLKLVPKNIQEVKFSLQSCDSSRFDVLFVKNLYNELWKDLGVIKTEENENNTKINEKRGKTFKLGLGKLEDKSVELRAKHDFLYSNFRDKLAVYFEQELGEMKIEIEKPNGAYPKLAPQVSLLLDKFNNWGVDPKNIFGKDDYPTFKKEITIEEIYDKVKYFPIPKNLIELSVKEKELKEKLEESAKIVDEKFKSRV